MYYREPAIYIKIKQTSDPSFRLIHIETDSGDTIQFTIPKSKLEREINSYQNKEEDQNKA